MSRRARQSRSHDAGGRESTTAGLAGVLVVGAAWAGVPWSLPLVAALPLVVARRRGAPWKWAVSVLAVSTITIGIVGERAAGTVPFADSIRAGVDAWLDGEAGAMPGPAWLAAWLAAFLLALRFGRGVLVWPVLATVLCGAALLAVSVYARAFNLIEAVPVAYPPWVLAMIAGMISLMSARSGTDTPPRRSRFVTTGAALVALAFLLRLALAPVYQNLVSAVTRG